MYEFLKGKLEELNPSYAIISNDTFGYMVQISLHTYTQLQGKEQAKLYLHHVIREDASIFFGFISKTEREFFRILISVSGIGANTARLFLSSLGAAEFRNAVLTDNVNLIKSIKGVGLKTAQRVIVELRDKVDKLADDGETNQGLKIVSSVKEEALSALVMLGFQKVAAEKEIDALIRSNAAFKVEDLIKNALKNI